MAKRKSNSKNESTSANIGYEAQLWRMVDVLRGSMEAAQIKHRVLGFIFVVRARY